MENENDLIPEKAFDKARSLDMAEKQSHSYNAQQPELDTSPYKHFIRTTTI